MCVVNVSCGRCVEYLTFELVNTGESIEGVGKTVG